VTKFLGILVAVLLSLISLDMLFFERSSKNDTNEDKTRVEDINLSSILQESLPSESVDFEKSTNKILPVEKKESPVSKKVFINSFKKPTLLIIMDDISHINEAKAIKKLKLKIVPSILPKTKNHPNTPKIAKMFKSVMIHLPLEAVSFSKPEQNTILVSDTKKVISKKLDKALKDFDNIVAINNHTGSKFTANKDVLAYLLSQIEKKSYLFIDSKTTYKSKYDEIQSEKGKKIFHRDIFLDNIQKISYIKNQIKKAVILAKKQGFVIAICHPHPITFKALNRSRKLLKSVRLVDIDEIQDTKIGRVTKTVKGD